MTESSIKECFPGLSGGSVAIKQNGDLNNSSPLNHVIVDKPETVVLAALILND